MRGERRCRRRRRRKENQHCRRRLFISMCLSSACLNMYEAMQCTISLAREQQNLRAYVCANLSSEFLYAKSQGIGCIWVWVECILARNKKNECFVWPQSMCFCFRRSVPCQCVIVDQTTFLNNKSSIIGRVWSCVGNHLNHEILVQAEHFLSHCSHHNRSSLPSPLAHIDISTHHSHLLRLFVCLFRFSLQSDWNNFHRRSVVVL